MFIYQRVQKKHHHNLSDDFHGPNAWSWICEFHAIHLDWISVFQCTADPNLGTVSAMSDQFWLQANSALPEFASG